MEAPEPGDLLGTAKEGPEQQPTTGEGCVPRTGEQGESQGAAELQPRREEVFVTDGEPGEEEQQQEITEGHDEPVADKKHGEGAGVEGQQPNSEKAQGPDELGQRMEELPGAQEQLARWGEELEGSTRADPHSLGQQERKIPQHLVMEGPGPQDASLCGLGPHQVSAVANWDQCGLKKGHESRMQDRTGESGVEGQRHPNTKEGEFQESWMEEPTVGLGIGTEPEVKTWTRDQEKERAMSAGMQCAYLLTSDDISEVKQLEEAIEEMLMRLDEFCGMTDMIRNETSQLLDEDIHAMKAKVEDMNKVYTKVDKLEAFVKMVGHHVTFLEEQLVQAEKDRQPFTQVVHKLLQSTSIPSFIYKHTAKQQPYELPELFRTEDYIPLGYVATQYRKT